MQIVCGFVKHSFFHDEVIYNDRLFSTDNGELPAAISLNKPNNRQIRSIETETEKYIPLEAPFRQVCPECGESPTATRYGRVKENDWRSRNIFTYPLYERSL